MTLLQCVISIGFVSVQKLFWDILTGFRFLEVGDGYSRSSSIHSEPQIYKFLHNGTHTASAPRTYFLPSNSLNISPPKSLFNIHHYYTKSIIYFFFIINLYSDLGGIQFISERSGADVKYYAQLGADTASKKLLGNGAKRLWTNQQQSSTAAKTYDIKVLYPVEYSAFTADNFICQIRNTLGQVLYGGTVGSDAKVANITYFTKSYDAVSGILSVTYYVTAAITSGVSGGNRYYPFDIYFVDTIS